MWKYIIIAAVVLFLGACFLFYKTNDAMTGPDGEVAAFQSQFDMAKKKVVDIEKDKGIKRYAELRTAYFKQQGTKFEEERVNLDAEDVPLVQEIAKANADLETAAADFKKYNDFYTAVQTGKDLKAVIQRYTDNGVDAKTLASQITSHFKPLYKEMSNTERAAIKGYLLNAYQLLGYNRYEKSKDIDAWLKD